MWYQRGRNKTLALNEDKKVKSIDTEEIDEKEIPLHDKSEDTFVPDVEVISDDDEKEDFPLETRVLNWWDFNEDYKSTPKNINEVQNILT